MASQFKILLSIAQKEGGEGVYYKHDGERFDHPHTLKLNKDTDYTITVQSPLVLRDVMIQGEKYDITKVKTEKGKHSEDYRFSATFNTTGFTVEKKTNRRRITIVLVFDAGVTFMTALQCKFYTQAEVEHSRWGTQLAWVEYGCQLTEGQSGVHIIKEVFH